MTTNKIEIQHATIKRSPLFNGSFFKLYLPQKVILRPHIKKTIDLKFKIKIPDSVNNQILLLPAYKQHLIEVRNKQLRSNIYQNVQLELTDKNNHFIYTIHPDTEIARLHLLQNKHFRSEHDNIMAKIINETMNQTKRVLEIEIS